MIDEGNRENTNITGDGNVIGDKSTSHVAKVDGEKVSHVTQIAGDIKYYRPQVVSKALLQEIIHQEQHTTNLPLYLRLTEPFWSLRAWQQYCRELAALLSYQEGVDQEFSELMAVLSPASLPVIINREEYELSAIIDQLGLRQVVVLGEPGSGKTTSLRHLAMIQARRVINSPRKFRIPIFASLGSYMGEDIVSFLQSKVAGYGKGRLGPVLPGYLSQGKFIIFFDALNEMPGDQYQRNIRQLRELLIDYPRNQYVFSCRTENYKGELDIPRAVIQPLSNDTIRDFILGYLGDSGAAFFEQLASEKLLDMVRNPFFLWMVLKTGITPENKGKLIEHFVNILLEREESKGEISRSYRWAPVDLVRQALEYLAFQMMDIYRTTVIARTEADNLLKSSNRELGEYECLSQGCEVLILRYTDDRKRNLGYWHQIIQEYFAAAYLERRFNELDQELLDELFDDPWWWETLILLGGLVQNRALFLEHVLGSDPSAQRVMLAAALFYSGEKTQVEQEKEILNRTLKVFQGGLPEDQEANIVNLAKIAGEKFLLKLGEQLLHQDPVTAETVVRLLTKVGGRDAAHILLKNLGFKKELDAVIYRELPKMGETIVEPVVRRSCRPARFLVSPLDGMQVIEQVGDLAVGKLIDLADSEEESIRLFAVRALGRIKGQVALHSLCQWLGDENERVHKEVINSLSHFASSEVVLVLEKIFKERNWRRRLAAVEVLGQLEAGVTKEYLLRASRDPNAEVRAAADFLLQPIPQQGSFDQLSLSQAVRMAVYDPDTAQRWLKRSGTLQRFDDIKRFTTVIADEYKIPRYDASPRSTTGTMSILEHIEELQQRLFLGFSGMWLFFLVVTVLYGPVLLPFVKWFYWGQVPVEVSPWRVWLPFSLSFAITLMVPWLLYQLWRFVAPGLTLRERAIFYRRIIPILIVAFLILIIVPNALSRYLVLRLYPTISNPSIRAVTVARLAFGFIYGATALVFWLLVKFSTFRPKLYDTLFFFVVFFLGPITQFLFGKERLDALRIRAGSIHAKKITSGWRGVILAGLVIILTLLIPFYSYVPILISAFLTLLLIRISDLPAVIHAVQQTLAHIKDLVSGVRREISQEQITGTSQSTNSKNNLKSHIKNLRNLLAKIGIHADYSASLKSHTEELRNLLTLSWILPLILATVILTMFFPSVIRGLQIIYSVPNTDALLPLANSFLDKLRLLLGIYFVIAIPTLTAGIWQFVKLGLDPHEKKFVNLVAMFISLTPFITIGVATIFSRFLGRRIADIPFLISLSNKIAITVVLFVILMIVSYVAALVKLERTWRILAQGIVILGVLMSVLWPLWAFSAITFLLVGAVCVMLWRLLEVSPA